MYPTFTGQYAHDRRSHFRRDAEMARVARSAKLMATDRLEIRALERTDIAQIEALYNGLSPRSRYLRFMSPIYSLSASLLEHLVAIDHDEHEALGAFDRDGLVASAHWFRAVGHRERAVVATEVTDVYQRRGVGSRLVRQLGSRARARGISEFRATVLADNAGAIALIRGIGLPIASTVDGAALIVTLST